MERHIASNASGQKQCHKSCHIVELVFGTYCMLMLMLMVMELGKLLQSVQCLWPSVSSYYHTIIFVIISSDSLSYHPIRYHIIMFVILSYSTDGC